jgi:MoaA/NifB/PqqE/SkfB family radical SAM enzyme
MNGKLTHCGLFVTLIDDCNANCCFCPFPPRAKAFRNGNKLDYNAFVKMLNKLCTCAPSLPLGSVCFCGSSEPLLYDRVVELVVETKKSVPYVSLVTNGILLCEKEGRNMSCGLLNAQIDHVVISITGNTPEVYRKYQGGGGSVDDAEKQFNLVRKNVEDFVNLRNKLRSPTQIGLSYILSQDSKDDLFRAMLHYHDIGVDYIDIRILSDGFVSDNDFKQKYGEYIENTVKQLDGIACTCFVKVMDVSTDGTLRFCNCSYIDENIIGNIFHTSLTDILLTKKFTDLRDAFCRDYENVPEFCKTCDLMRARPILA